MALERDTPMAFRHACWCSWREQTRSIEKLLAQGSAEELHEHLDRCVARMKSQ